MKPEFEYLIDAIRGRYISKIGPANQNPNKWYELLVDEGEELGTHTVVRADAFSDLVKEFESYAEEYGLDHINIDIWRMKGENDMPKTDGIGLCPTNLMHFFLHWYFNTEGKHQNIKMIGTSVYPNNGGKPTFTKDYRGESQYYADEIAFRYFRDRVCYIPEHGDENDPTSHYTRNRLIELCGGNEKRAAQLFTHLSWECPETLLEQWEATDGMFDDEDYI